MGVQTPITRGYMDTETPTHLDLHPELNLTLETVRQIPTHLAKGF